MDLEKDERTLISTMPKHLGRKGAPFGATPGLKGAARDPFLEGCATLQRVHEHPALPKIGQRFELAGIELFPGVEKLFRGRRVSELALNGSIGPIPVFFVRGDPVVLLDSQKPTPGLPDPVAGQSAAYQALGGEAQLLRGHARQRGFFQDQAGDGEKRSLLNRFHGLVLPKLPVGILVPFLRFRRTPCGIPFIIGRLAHQWALLFTLRLHASTPVPIRGG